MQSSSGARSNRKAKSTGSRMTLAFPIALFGLLAVPALVAVYWLRNKHRRQVVSSLMLWADEGKPKEGGLVLDRLRTPLTFFLELLAILLLTLAAAGPMVNARAEGGVLTIVLDDSFSMLAGRADSPRNRAAAAAEEELESGGYDSVKIVLAGEKPSLLGEAGGRPAQIRPLLARWNCPEPSANLEEAIAFAFALAGSRGRVLVLTDHPQSHLADAEANTRLRWLAFGKDSSNVAIVNATRTANDAGERCMIEIVNLSREAAKATLVVEDYADLAATQARQLAAYDLDLAPNAGNRVVFNLKPGAGPMRARIADDALAIDNVAVLLPQSRKHVRVELRIGDEKLKASVEKALLAAGIAELNSRSAELVFADDEQITERGSETWTVQFIAEHDAVSYAGPFVIDRGHPLAEGLSLDGVVWAAGRTPSAGRPIITAGDVALLTDVERAGSHNLRWRLKPDLSTLQDTPAWPVLIWNLIDWRASQAPGFKQANVRLGSSAVLTVREGVRTINIQPPNGAASEVPAGGQSLAIKAETWGVYEVTAGGVKYNFAANALSRQESDLTKCASGSWDGWNAGVQDIQQRSIAWVLVLLALIVLAAHLVLASRGGAVRLRGSN